MSATFGVNPETVFALALFSNHPQRKEAVAQYQERQRERWEWNLTAPEIAVRRIFNEALSSLPHDAVYGPLSKRLVRSHVDQIDFTVLDWALRGHYGIFLKEEEEERKDPSATQETALFWNAVTENTPLSQRLKRLSGDWDGNVRRGGHILRSHIQLHCLAVARNHEGSFLIQTFLGMSLERMNWIEVAALVVGIPYVPQPPLESEEREEPDLMVQLAYVQEIIFLSQQAVGGYVLETGWSHPLQSLCADLADQCNQAQQRLKTLQKNDRAFATKTTRTGSGVSPSPYREDGDTMEER